MKDGTYFAKMMSEDAVASETKDGNPQMVLRFNITHFREGDAWVAIAAVDRTLYLSLHGGAWEYTQKKLAALGFQGDFESPAFAGEAAEVGVSLTLKHEDYKGKETERWDLANWGGSNAEPASKDVTRQLNARWRAEVGSGPTAAKAPAVPAQAPVATATPPTDTEMPPAREPGSGITF